MCWQRSGARKIEEEEAREKAIFEQVAEIEKEQGRRVFIGEPTKLTNKVTGEVLAEMRSMIAIKDLREDKNQERLIYRMDTVINGNDITMKPMIYSAEAVNQITPQARAVYPIEKIQRQRQDEIAGIATPQSIKRNLEGNFEREISTIRTIAVINDAVYTVTPEVELEITRTFSELERKLFEQRRNNSSKQITERHIQKRKAATDSMNRTKRILDEEDGLGNQHDDGLKQNIPVSKRRRLSSEKSLEDREPKTFIEQDPLPNTDENDNVGENVSPFVKESEIWQPAHIDHIIEEDFEEEKIKIEPIYITSEQEQNSTGEPETFIKQEPETIVK